MEIEQQKEFEFRIMDPENVIFDGMVVSASIMTNRGQMTILYKHMPIVSVTEEGKIFIKTKDGAEESFNLKSDGVVIVQPSGKTNLLLYKHTEITV